MYIHALFSFICSIEASVILISDPLIFNDGAFSGPSSHRLSDEKLTECPVASSTISTVTLPDVLRLKSMPPSS